MGGVHPCVSVRAECGLMDLELSFVMDLTVTGYLGG